MCYAPPHEITPILSLPHLHNFFNSLYVTKSLTHITVTSHDQICLRYYCMWHDQFNLWLYVTNSHTVTINIVLVTYINNENRTSHTWFSSPSSLPTMSKIKITPPHNDHLPYQEYNHRHRYHHQQKNHPTDQKNHQRVQK